MRRRMLNPEFFTDPDIVANFDAFGRLFYQGLWCVAEDSGCLELNPLLLKMKIFPGDNISLEQIQEYIDKLVDMEKVVAYEVDDKDYGWIKNFHKHQTLSKPSPPTVPLPSWIIFHGEEEFDKKRHEYYYEIKEKRQVQDVSRTEERQVQDVSCPEEKLKEVKLSKEKLSKEEDNKEPVKQAPSVPYQKIADLYNKHCPDMTKVIKVSDRRKDHLRARWKEFYDQINKNKSSSSDSENITEQILSEFEKIFQKAGKSKFMNGQNDKNWHADFDWMIKNNSNYIKILEGKYDDKTMGGNNSPPKSKGNKHKNYGIDEYRNPGNEEDIAEYYYKKGYR